MIYELSELSLKIVGHPPVVQKAHNYLCLVITNQSKRKIYYTKDTQTWKMSNCKNGNIRLALLHLFGKRATTDCKVLVKA